MIRLLTCLVLCVLVFMAPCFSQDAIINSSSSASSIILKNTSRIQWNAGDNSGLFVLRPETNALWIDYPFRVRSKTENVFFECVNPSSNQDCYKSRKESDSYYRFRYQADGRVIWGPGDGRYDLNLWRSRDSVLSLWAGATSTAGTSYYPATFAVSKLDLRPSINIDVVFQSTLGGYSSSGDPSFVIQGEGALLWNTTDGVPFGAVYPNNNQMHVTGDGLILDGQLAVPACNALSEGLLTFVKGTVASFPVPSFLGICVSNGSEYGWHQIYPLGGSMVGARKGLVLIDK
jgi:hypothetical protein